MPINLYSPNDNYYLNNPHVLLALIHKIHEAKQVNASEVVTMDCVFLLEQPANKLAKMFNDEQPSLINLGCGDGLTIRALAELAAEVVGFTNSLAFDTRKPDVTMRNVMDVSRINSLGWSSKVWLSERVMLADEIYRG